MTIVSLLLRDNRDIFLWWQFDYSLDKGEHQRTLHSSLKKEASNHYLWGQMLLVLFYYCLFYDAFNESNITLSKCIGSYHLLVN